MASESQNSDTLSTVDTEQFHEYENSSQSSSQRPSSKKRPRTAPIWNHSIDQHTVYTNAAGKSLWRCKYCSQQYQESLGTKVAIDHLAKEHSIQIQGALDIRIRLRQLWIDTLQDELSSNKRQRWFATVTQATPTHTLDPEIL
jgi:hypothetical protein